MPKEFTYTNSRTGKVIFQSVEANYVSKDDVDHKVKAQTGQDPRLERHIIECQIRVVGEPKTTRSFGRFDKNKKLGSNAYKGKD